MLGASKPDINKKKNGVDYEKLGKTVEDTLVLDYVYLLGSTKRQIWSTFIRGVFAGVGGVLGATVGIAILVGILQLFGGFPVIGDFFKDAGETIQNGPASPVR
jgi:Domain of unknown function (DUF5665)